MDSSLHLVLVVTLAHAAVRLQLSFNFTAAMSHQRSFTAPLPGGRPLQRSSWKAEAIRKGQLKISGPIPWADDELDEQVNKRHTDLFLPQHKESSSLDDAHDRDGAEQSAAGRSFESIANSGAQQQQQQQQQQPPERPQRPVSMGISTLNGTQMSQMSQRHVSPNPTASYDGPDPYLSGGADSPNNTSPKKKRRSGLRNVFRKMFGRRSKDGFEQQQQQQHQQQHQQGDASPPRAAQQHTARVSREREKPNSRKGQAANHSYLVSRQGTDEPVADAAAQRIRSVAELQPRTPLGSHLPFPMNVNAPQEISPPHEYLTFDGLDAAQHPRVVQRRASLPSVVFSSADAAALSAFWAADNAPVTAQDEENAVRASEEREIGVALSSPKRVKRRSRSAGALHDLTKDWIPPVEAILPPRTPRRRSAEIRYWRSSGVSASVYSEQRPTTGDDEHKSKTRSFALTQAAAAATTTTTDTDEAQGTGTKQTPAAAAAGELVGPRITSILDPEQIQAFNFGDLGDASSAAANPDASEHTPTMTDMSTLSIEDSSFLDDHVVSLEHARPFTTHHANHPIILQDVKNKRFSRDRSHSPPDSSSSRTSSTHRGLFAPPIVLPDMAPYHAASTVEKEKTNIITSPDLSTPPSLPAGDAPLATSLAAEQFSAIYTILRHERAARKALERQVITMQHELQEMRSIVHKLTNVSYPTPSPDAGTHAGSTRRPNGRFGSFDSADDVEDNRDGNGNGSQAAGRRSPEVFETPREESAPYGFGFGVAQTARAVVVGEGGKF